MNFANVRNEQIIDMNSNYLDADIINVEVTDNIYDIWKNDKNKVVYKDGEVIIDPEYEEKQAQQREEQFNKEFFQTSLGYIRREVSMATGETKDFLSDLLPTISMGVQIGRPVQIIAYDKPDFTQEITDWAELQNVKTVTAEFVQECFLQLSNDFKPVEDTSKDTSEQVTDQVSEQVSEQVEVQDENTTDTTTDI